jgi:hypothetical protein
LAKLAPLLWSKGSPSIDTKGGNVDSAEGAVSTTAHHKRNKTQTKKVMPLGPGHCRQTAWVEILMQMASWRGQQWLGIDGVAQMEETPV